LADKQDVYKEIRDDFQQAIQKEKHCISEFSPGCVASAEFILRQVFSPAFVEEDGLTIKADAFIDVFKDSGLSVNRQRYSSEGQLHIAAQKRLDSGPSDKKREHIGLARGSVEKVRQVLDENHHQAMVVLDSALENDLSHADIIGYDAPKKLKKRIKTELLDIFSSIIAKP
jgi:hypothetical protein